MKHIQKFVIIILTIVLISIVLSNLHKEPRLSDEIVKAIEYKTGDRSSCTINISEITKFKWDKMAFYTVGSSNIEVSNALGVWYNESTDSMTGLVFVFHGKIVYQEQIPYYPEQPAKLWLWLPVDLGSPNCIVVFPYNAVFIGSKDQDNGKCYYEITPEQR